MFREWQCLEPPPPPPILMWSINFWSLHDRKILHTRGRTTTAPLRTEHPFQNVRIAPPSRWRCRGHVKFCSHPAFSPRLQGPERGVCKISLILFPQRRTCDRDRDRWSKVEKVHLPQRIVSNNYVLCCHAMLIQNVTICGVKRPKFVYQNKMGNFDWQVGRWITILWMLLRFAMVKPNRG